MEYHKDDRLLGKDELVSDVWSALSATTVTPVLRWPDGTLDKKNRLGIDTYDQVACGDLQLRHGALALVLG